MLLARVLCPLASARVSGCPYRDLSVVDHIVTSLLVLVAVAVADLRAGGGGEGQAG